MFQPQPRTHLRNRHVIQILESAASDTNAGLNWNCPVCKLELEHKVQTWICINGHSFDIARLGYVNLLLAQHKKSRDPGDDQETVRARQYFLRQGHYDPLAQKISDVVASAMSATSRSEKFHLLDSGCGDAWYLDSLQKLLPPDVTESIDFIGLDISRPAIQAAAKSVKNARFAIASAFSIPLPTKTLNLVMQVFAPSAVEEIHRILKPEGIFIVVTPGKNHLLKLREKIYAKVNQHEKNQPEKKYFEKIIEKTSTFELNLQSTDDIKNLLRMTPHYWKIRFEQREQLLNESSLRVTADFVISAYRKTAIEQFNPWRRNL